MENSEIRNSIKKDVSELQNHYKEAAPFFIDPKLIEFEDVGGNNLKLWAIFKKDEYFITFNPQNRHYGLAFRNILNILIYLGDYGSLTDSYENLISQNE